MSENNQKIKITNSTHNIQNIFFGVFNSDPLIIGNKLPRPETPFSEIEENDNFYINIRQASQENIELVSKNINELL